MGWSEEDAEAIVNWLICTEMLIAAVGMLFAFPHSEYQLGGAASPGWSWESLKHAISITDVVEDIMLQVRSTGAIFLVDCQVLVRLTLMPSMASPACSSTLTTSHTCCTLTVGPVKR